jgi:hypothetical protein
VAALATGLRGEDGGLHAATVDFFRRNAVSPDQVEFDALSAEPILGQIARGIGSGFAARLA